MQTSLHHAKKCELISREKPHIVAINEVKPKNGSERKEKKFCHRTYFSIFNTNIDSTSGRGITILTHSSISHRIFQKNNNNLNQTSSRSTAKRNSFLKPSGALFSTSMFLNRQGGVWIKQTINTRFSSYR